MKSEKVFSFFCFFISYMLQFIYININHIKNMKRKIKNIMLAIHEWDKKNTSFHSWTYMLIFLTAAAVVFSNLNQAAAGL